MRERRWKEGGVLNSLNLVRGYIPFLLLHLLHPFLLSFFLFLLLHLPFSFSFSFSSTDLNRTVLEPPGCNREGGEFDQVEQVFHFKVS